MYSEGQRLIYGPYPTGNGPPVHGDPIKIERRLIHALNGEPNTWFEKMKSDDEAISFEAVNKVLEAIVYAFEVKPFLPNNSNGLVEDQLIDLLNDFLDWREKNGLRVEKSPTCSLPTGQPYEGPLDPAIASIINAGSTLIASP